MSSFKLSLRFRPLLTIVFVLTGCGKYGLDWRTGEGAEPPPTIREYSLEGVKLISASISDGRDPRSFGQDEYTVSPTDHLLLRLLELKSHVESVRLREGDLVELKVTLAQPAHAEDAKAELQACPVLRNWTYLATWENAHPFSGQGRWTSSGGDYDQPGCVQAWKVEDGTLRFDVTRWFRDFPLGRGKNYGLLLRSRVPIAVLGETSPSRSPRLTWKENPRY
ncbi:MAG: hypothetical protein NDJ89_05285 [Oligoflexia bacterium]|nr:hypothetical protein [Oligoflexia bacterium]